MIIITIIIEIWRFFQKTENILSLYIYVYQCVMNMTPMGTEVQRTFHAIIAVAGSRPESSQSVIHMIGSTSSC